MNQLTIHKSHRCFQGVVHYCRHPSKVNDCEMRFAIFVPEGATGPMPTLYFLAGLTCTEENFFAKAGAQKYAAENKMVLVAPDTSPRGLDIPGDSSSWDFGAGAGFYVNATRAPYSKNYRMFDYVRHELPDLIENRFPVSKERAVMGHSMGGHGALVLGLRCPDFYRSVSAFAPICVPSKSPWGQKAFKGYLGENVTDWQDYDANELVERFDRYLPTRIDQGGADEFLTSQLGLSVFKETCIRRGFPADIRVHPGYDHSYYFISTLVQEHIEFHSKHLN